MSHFYFALTNPEAESLLKEEIKHNYPDLKLSYSRPGFLTFKALKSVSFKPLFARIAGESQGKFKLAELDFEKAWVWNRTPELIIPTELKNLSERSSYKMGEKVTLIMMTGEDEYWIGEYPLVRSHLQTPGEVSSILIKEVPSRAYYKLAEAFESFDLPFDHEERVLELGSAPGGASLFLLDQDMKVLGVDPAEMDPGILRHINFKHLKKPFETVTADNFSDNVDWIVSDVNLPPTVVVREVLRMLTFLQPHGLVLTLKINQDKQLWMLQKIVQDFKSQGFTQVELKYLPSHRQEIALVAIR